MSAKNTHVVKVVHFREFSEYHGRTINKTTYILNNGERATFADDGENVDAGTIADTTGFANA